MMSMAGGWFFVTASEAFAVGATNVNLPGVGAYIAAANDRQGDLERERDVDRAEGVLVQLHHLGGFG